eukprot:g78264.t1
MTTRKRRSTPTAKRTYASHFPKLYRKTTDPYGFTVPPRHRPPSWRLGAPTHYIVPREEAWHATIMEMEYWSLQLGFNLLPADWQNVVGLCRYCPSFQPPGGPAGTRYQLPARYDSRDLRNVYRRLLRLHRLRSKRRSKHAALPVIDGECTEKSLHLDDALEVQSRCEGRARSG